MPVEDWSTDAHEMRPTNRTRLYLMEKSVKKGMPEKRNKIKEQIQKDKSKNDDKKWKKKEEKRRKDKKDKKSKKDKKDKNDKKDKKDKKRKKVEKAKHDSHDGRPDKKRRRSI